jgi:hypothetical protein
MILGSASWMTRRDAEIVCLTRSLLCSRLEYVKNHSAEPTINEVEPKSQGGSTFYGQGRLMVSWKGKNVV